MQKESTTTTLVIEKEAPQTEERKESSQPVTVISLKPSLPKKRIYFAEDVIDNEGMGRWKSNGNFIYSTRVNEFCQFVASIINLKD